MVGHLRIWFLCFLLNSCQIFKERSNLSDFTEFDTEQKVQDFTWIVAIFEENYGMLEYKEKRLGKVWGNGQEMSWQQLKAAYLEKAKAAPDRTEFAAVIQEFVAKMEDAHTSAHPLRNTAMAGELKAATLGFTVKKELRGESTVLVVDRVIGEVLGNNSSVSVGDVLVSINDRTPEQIIKEDILRYINLGQRKSNETLGIKYLTVRPQSRLAKIPAGPAKIAIRRGEREISLVLPWVLAPVRKLAPPGSQGSTITSRQVVNGKSTFVETTKELTVEDLTQIISNPSTLRMGLLQQQDSLLTKMFSAEPGDDYPTRLSVAVGNLPFTILRTKAGVFAIYRIEDFVQSRILFGKPEQIGEGITIRTGRPLTADDYAAAFNQLADGFDVKGIILDLRGNGGGFLDLGYELVSSLVLGDYPANKFSVRLNEPVYLDLREAAKQGPLAWREGYSAQLRILEEDIRQKRRMSQAIPLSGIPHIAGHSSAYEGRLYVLVDEMCASMCDIFAAIMQDLKRAVILGSQTMGAGGNVISAPYSQRTKIALSQTASIIYRLDGTTPLENLGVTPDVEIDNTDSYHYWRKVVEYLEGGSGTPGVDVPL